DSSQGLEKGHSSGLAPVETGILVGKIDRDSDDLVVIINRFACRVSAPTDGCNLAQPNGFFPDDGDIDIGIQVRRSSDMTLIVDGVANAVETGQIADLAQT